MGERRHAQAKQALVDIGLVRCILFGVPHFVASRQLDEADGRPAQEDFVRRL
jgi:hypothetical protein